MFVAVFLFSVTVQMVLKARERDYDKQHSCYYCGDLYKKISRHLLTVHRSESDIRSIDNDRRRMTLDRLRNMGDFHHNVMC